MATTHTTTLTNNLLARQPISTAPSPQPQRVRPYKDFLTPALHRRFIRAALLSLAGCYLTSLFISPPSPYWFWNPLSATTIRALLLFIPCLCVFIVRVANMRCGSLNAASSAHTVLEMLGSWRGVSTLWWYACSAWLFGEVYIWSHDASAALGWVDPGTRWERARVNENPIFLRALFFVLAVGQTCVHLGSGEDRIPIPEKDENPTMQQQQQQSFWSIPTSLLELKDRAPTIAFRILRLTLPTFALTMPTYFLLSRRILWPLFYNIISTFYRPGHGEPPLPSHHTGLTHISTLGAQCIYSSVLLIALWELTSAAFTIFVAQPPLTRTAQPLTGDELRSKDPSGSLISGLKSKKEVTRAFAFWELSLICTYFDARRKTIYTEVDRQGGSTWMQISKFCLDEISAIQDRIRAAQLPPPPPQQQQSSQDLSLQQQQQQPLGLPKIADRGLQTGDVWAKPSSNFSNSVGNVAKSFGQSPNSHNPLVPRAKRAIEWSAERVLSKDEQQRLTTEGLSKEAGGMVQQLLRTPVGEPFRQTFARKVRSVVFGAPVGRENDIIHASRALSTLCSHSLKEDDYGQVAKSVALIIRTYMGAIIAIQNFTATTRPEWTDVSFTERDRHVRDVREVVAVLKEGLEEVVLAFGEYASAVGLSKVELREARELVGRGQEMGKK